MASALGHNVPMVFTIVFAGGCMLAGLAGVIGGNYQTTEPAMADAHGSDRVRRRGVRRAWFAGRMLHRLDPDGHDPDLRGRDQCIRSLDLLKPLGVTLPDEHISFAEIMMMPVARIGALLPFVMMVLILLFRPRGLMGTRDT